MTELIELVSTIDELVELHKFLDDPNIDVAMNRVVKLVASPDVPHAKILVLITELQALSGVCAMKATYYATLGKAPAGTPNNMKKNIYYTFTDTLDKMVSALKYMARPV